MAYDEVLAARIRSLLVERGDVTERKMFGGIAYMVADHMAVGVIRDDLMVRVGSDAEAAALAEPHARPMNFTGQPGARHGVRRAGRRRLRRRPGAVGRAGCRLRGIAAAEVNRTSPR